MGSAEGIIRSTVSLMVLAVAVVIISGGKVTSASAPADFIRVSCKGTRYPQVCMQCLSAYAPAVQRSPRQLAHAALVVSAARARAASTLVSSLSAGGARSTRSKEGGAVRDCLETLSDTVDRLLQSVKELGRMGRAGSERFNWHLSNVQTWVSAALTDENTCLDSLSQDEGTAKYRSKIRKKIVEVAQVTSNALALVNRLQLRN